MHKSITDSFIKISSGGSRGVLESDGVFTAEVAGTGSFCILCYLEIQQILYLMQEHLCRAAKLRNVDLISNAYFNKTTKL